MVLVVVVVMVRCVFFKGIEKFSLQKSFYSIKYLFFYFFFSFLLFIFLVLHLPCSRDNPGSALKTWFRLGGSYGMPGIEPASVLDQPLPPCYHSGPKISLLIPVSVYKFVCFSVNHIFFKFSK